MIKSGRMKTAFFHSFRFYTIDGRGNICLLDKLFIGVRYKYYFFGFGSSSNQRDNSLSITS